jgi:hypothetical protein
MAGWCLALVCAAAGPNPGSRQGESRTASDAPVVVTSDPRYRETTYSVERGTCRIGWVVHSAGIDAEAILQRSECSLPFSEQIPLIAKIMARVFGDTSDPGAFRTLYWGRLYPDGQPDPVLGMRLALAAKRSPLWDAARGLPRSGNVNTVVRRLANEPPIYVELRELFRKAGMDIEVTSVEKVLVLPAQRLPFASLLPQGEIRATDKLPFDCQTWFAISKAK